MIERFFASPSVRSFIGKLYTFYLPKLIFEVIFGTVKYEIVSNLRKATNLLRELPLRNFAGSIR